MRKTARVITVIVLMILIPMVLGWLCYLIATWIEHHVFGPSAEYKSALLGLFLFVPWFFLNIVGVIYDMFGFPETLRAMTTFVAVCLSTIAVAQTWSFLSIREEKAKEIEETRLNSIREENQRQRERKVQEARLEKEKEVQRRKNIALDIKNVLYKQVEREVNKTRSATLIHELSGILDQLQSDNLNDIILDGALQVFDNYIAEVKSELHRLKKLALEMQSKGYQKEEKKEQASSHNEIPDMTKEKAFFIFGLKQTATKDEIKTAYRELVKKYNTDQRQHYEEHVQHLLETKMKEVNNAKEYFSTLGLI